MPSEHHFTISEVSQKTGVTSITLRAWERRYGLVKPKRTPKGHRIYTQDNIDEIHAIVAWLNRGVAISKVSPLLNKALDTEQAATADSHWQIQITQYIKHVIGLEHIQLNQFCDKLGKGLPLDTLCQQFYQPLGHALSLRWQNKPHGYELEQQLWQQTWQRQITLMTLRAEKQKSFATTWLINLDEDVIQHDYWCLYGLLLQAGLRVYPINKKANLDSLSRIEPSQQGMIVFAHSRQTTLTSEKISDLHKSHDNLILVGKWIDIHQDKFENMTTPNVSGDCNQIWLSPEFQQWLTQLKES